MTPPTHPALAAATLALCATLAPTAYAGFIFSAGNVQIDATTQTSGTFDITVDNTGAGGLSSFLLDFDFDPDDRIALTTAKFVDPNQAFLGGTGVVNVIDLTTSLTDPDDARVSATSVSEFVVDDGLFVTVGFDLVNPIPPASATPGVIDLGLTVQGLASGVFGATDETANASVADPGSIELLVPEPASLALVALGFAALASRSRRCPVPRIPDQPAG